MAPQKEPFIGGERALPNSPSSSRTYEESNSNTMSRWLSFSSKNTRTNTITMTMMQILPQNSRNVVFPVMLIRTAQVFSCPHSV
ncbi:hypothetical protein WDU94_001515 [Cyamophila willieti]